MPAIIIAVLGAIAAFSAYTIALLWRMLPWLLVAAALWFAVDYLDLQGAVADWRASLQTQGSKQ